MKEHPFSSDRPITRRAEDALGRSGFAKALADSIQSWKEKDSLVIGLFGPWGQGKTSLKNMILDFLQDSGKDAPYVVEFNPWQWSGQAQIAQAFFGRIADQLGRKSAGGNPVSQAAKWRQYAALLNFGEGVTRDVPKAIPDILISIAFLCGIGGFIENPKVRFAAIFLAVFFAATAGVLRMASGLAENVAKYFEAKCRFTEEKPDEVRLELRHMMQALPKPVLVVIDDIDRLSPAEIRLVFQLVKSNADFPNMIYMLLFERDVVEKALEKGGEQALSTRGHDYIEKVINVAFDLPRIEQVRVDRYLGERLKMVFADVATSEAEETRAGKIYHLQLRHFFKDLRDVKRYISSLEFHLNLFRSAGTIEVNPTDLIVMEVLRVFEPEVYDSLPGVKSYVTSIASLTSDAQKKETQSAIDSVLAKSSAGNRDTVKELLKELFPAIERLYGGCIHGHESHEEWYRARRVGHEDAFDRYFLLRVADGDIAYADIERLLSKAGDRAGCVAELKSFSQQGLLSRLLDRLEAYKTTIEVKDATAFITALFDIGDDLPNDTGGLLGMSPDLHVGRIVYWCLRQEADIRKRGSILVAATRATTGLYMPVAEANSEDKGRAEPTDKNTILVDEQSCNELKRICLKKIECAAHDGSLIRNRQLRFLLHIWQTWSGSDEASRWLKDEIKNHESLLKVLVAFLSRSTSWSMNDGIPKVHWRFDLEHLEKFISTDDFLRHVDGIAGDDLDETQRLAIDQFRRVLTRKRSGKPYTTSALARSLDDDD